MFDLNNIPFLGSPSYYPGGNTKKKIVIHSTEGGYQSSLDWMRRPATEAAAHYIISEDGERCTQLVRDSDMAWHTGNSAYNGSTIGIEHSWVSHKEDGSKPDIMPSEGLYRAGAALTAKLCKKYGIVPNRGNIIAHGEVPPPNDHTDPGKWWDWGKYMAYVVQAFNASSNADGGISHVADNQPPKPAPAPVEPPVIFIPQTGRSLGFGFKNFWNNLDGLGDNYRLLILGYPVTNEFDIVFSAAGSVKRTVQLFERGGLIFEAENPDPWKTHTLNLAQLMEAYDYAVGNSLITADSRTAFMKGRDNTVARLTEWGEVLQNTLEAYASEGLSVEKVKALGGLVQAMRAGQSYSDYLKMAK